MSSPIAAYRTVGLLIDGAPSAIGAPETGGSSFAQTLQQVAKDAMSTLRSSETAALQGVAGTVDTHQVVAAMTRAELTLQAAVTVRDKMVTAYQEIMRMPV